MELTLQPLRELGAALLAWTGLLPEILLLTLAVLIAHRIGTPIMLRLTTRLPYSHRTVQYGNRAGRAVLVFFAVLLLLRNHPPTVDGLPLLQHIAALGLIASLTWLSIRCVHAIADTVIARHPANLVDNLQARRVHTQTKVLERCATVLLIVIGSGLALMTLPLLRQFGTSILASAGAAGLVLGFAAKPVLGNLLAGLQLALTQPIRLEDVVIVENEWGWVEEITGTYVVVRLWDQRRMIVPLQWFIEHPFQNWTRNSAELLGTVHLWVDYRMPLAPLREEAGRICRADPDWDGRVCVLHVVETGEKSMQVRVLVSAQNAGAAWELRCRVREALVTFVAYRYPAYLPRLRAEKDEKDGKDGKNETDEAARGPQEAAEAPAAEPAPAKRDADPRRSAPPFGGR